MTHEDEHGTTVVRRLLQQEVQHKFHGRKYQVKSSIPAEHPLALRWFGNSCNADMICGNLDLLWQHVRPVCTARPTHINQLVAPGLEQKVLDVMRDEKRRFEQIKAGQRPTVDVPDLVVEQPIPDPRLRNAYWYLGDYNVTKNMDDIKTVQEMDRPPATVNVAWVARLALASHDRQVAGMLVDGVDPGNERQPPVVVCHNHASSLLAHRLVNKCHHEENAAGRNTFWRPEVKVWQDLAHKTGGKVIWDASTSARKVVNYVPFICTPLGAVPKKLADGTIDPDNCRPTSDFSWPVPSVPLAAFVTAPNDLISLDDLPPFRWFSLREFFEQVHYLNQFGVELELSKFDLARYYRAFRMLANAIPSHMQLWLDEESPFLIADWRMMFGCRAAANFASRASVFICWLVRFAIEHI